MHNSPIKKDPNEQDIQKRHSNILYEQKRKDTIADLDKMFINKF